MLCIQWKPNQLSPMPHASIEKEKQNKTKKEQKPQPRKTIESKKKKKWVYVRKSEKN